MYKAFLLLFAPRHCPYVRVYNVELSGGTHCANERATLFSWSINLAFLFTTEFHIIAVSIEIMFSCSAFESL